MANYRCCCLVPDSHINQLLTFARRCYRHPSGGFSCVWVESTSMETKRPSRWQFTTRTLLFLFLCIAGLLAGYRVGYYGGTERRRQEAFSTKVYSVSDFASADEVIEAITRNIDPENWQDVGGPGTVSGAPDDPGSLVIYQTGANHDSVERLIHDLRKAKAK